MAKGIKLKLTVHVEIYQNILCASRLSKGHIYKIPRSAKFANLKLSGYAEEDIEINCKTLCVSRLSHY